MYIRTHMHAGFLFGSPFHNNEWNTSARTHLFVCVWLFQHKRLTEPVPVSWDTRCDYSAIYSVTPLMTRHLFISRLFSFRGSDGHIKHVEVIIIVHVFKHTDVFVSIGCFHFSWINSQQWRMRYTVYIFKFNT